MGGYYDGGSSPTYYRIDFNPGLEGHPFGQILRNYRYVFRIRKVTGPGWSDPALAAVNRATGIVAEIRPWENFTTEMYFEGDNYFGLSSRNVTLGYQAGRVDTVDVQTTVPYAIQWLDTSGTPVGSAVSGVGASLPDNGGFTVAIARNSDDAETVTRLIFTTTGDNRTQSEATAGLRITAGRWTLDVSVKQESPEKYRKRFIRVLSVTEVGSFGTNNPAAASGQPLRRILDNAKNFSPSGTVIVGGFSFTEASRAEIQATSTGSGSDIFQNVKNTINTQDVIYLTYNSPISDELAKVVLSWLRSSPNRVLIVGTDTDATNANLRSYLTADGTWKYYNQSPAVGGKFKRAAQTDGNRRFFTSPFGTVAENAPIARADDYAGYCLNYPAGVTPLVVSDAVGYEKAMIVGVNRQDRIVYHGDANLNQNGRLSSQANANGSVTSDFDRLTANLWAWIVEQVCEQDECPRRLRPFAVCKLGDKKRKDEEVYILYFAVFGSRIGRQGRCPGTTQEIVEPTAEPEAALPLLEVKTNALYWTTASLNAGFEVGLTPRITFEIDAGYNPWTFSDNRKFKFWMIQPEIRHWFRNRFEGHFLGVHLLYADFNVGGMKFLGMSDRRYQGALYGAGVAYGYRWPLGKNWSVEATAALGYLRSDYDRYVWKKCGRHLGRGHKNYFGPTKVGVSFGFTIR